MNRFWSRRIQSIVPYTPGEQPKDRKFIKLNTNECPEPPSAQVLEAVRAAAAELPRKQLLQYVDRLEALRADARFNVGVGHLCGALAAGLSPAGR